MKLNEELRELAITRAIEKHRYDGAQYDDWWECAYDWFVDVGKALGIEFLISHSGNALRLEIYFDQYFNVTFTGAWEFNDMARLLIRAECPKDPVLHDIADSLHETAMEFMNKWGALEALMVNSASGYYSMGVSVTHRQDISDAAIHCGINPDNIPDDFDDKWYAACSALENDVLDAAKKFSKWMGRVLRDESEWLSSDECVRDWVEANLDDDDLAEFVADELEEMA